MDSIYKTLFEDQKYLSGVDSYVDWMKRTAPVQMSLSDILDMNKEDNKKGPPIYPYNVQNLENLIKSEMDSNQTILNEIQTIKKNPIIKNDKLKSHLISKIEKKIENAIKEYYDILNDIKYLTIDKN